MAPRVDRTAPGSSASKPDNSAGKPGSQANPRSAVNDLRADITYTAGGVPHIRATSYRGAGYGFGYAIAKDNLCLLADGYVTVNGERSRYLGPSAAPGGSFSTASTNLMLDVEVSETTTVDTNTTYWERNDADTGWTQVDRSQTMDVTEVVTINGCYNRDGNLVRGSNNPNCTLP